MSTYDTALQASRDYVDTRTPAQKKWDQRAYQIGEYIARMRAMTQVDRVTWSRDPNARQAMHDYLTDALRELAQLNLEGFREGDTFKRVEAPAAIEARPVGTGEKIVPLGKAS